MWILIVWTINFRELPSSVSSLAVDVDERKQRLLDIWHGMQQTVIDRAVNERRDRCWRRVDVLNIECDCYTNIDDADCSLNY